MAVDAEELARVQQAHHVRLLGLQDVTGALVGDAWDAYADLNDIAAAEFTAAAAEIVDTAKRQTSTLAVGYMTANDQIGGFPDSGLLPNIPTIRGGVPTVDVYQRSIVQARRLVAAGDNPEAALAAGRRRAVQTAKTDVSLANRGEMERGQLVRPWVVGYRRVLTGRSCAFCATASTQRYKSASLLPLHPACDCDVAEIIGTADPGRIINRDLLRALRQAGKDDDLAKYWEGDYVVDADGTIHRPKRETLRDGTERTVPGAKVEAHVTEHGELGATLQTGRPTSTKRIDTTPAPPKSPAELAERTSLEDRARTSAAKRLTVDDPDLVDVAARFGVHPDEVLTARARVADVRKLARESAARVQADALAELDSLGVGRIVNPPRIGAKTDMGATARRGEWDWLERLSPRERARLSRQWYGGTQAPDQIADTMSAALNRDLSVDDAMARWLDLNRRSEAAGALRRGKLPSIEAYSGRIDPARLLPDIVDEGYDVEILFGDDLAAAAHVAQVEQQLVRDEALQFLGDAFGATAGPSPYRMSFQTWEAEVRDLEHDIAEGFADDAARRRYAELVPQYLDEPGLDFEELYGRIVSTARKAGEEIPAHAVIPWS